MAGSGTGTGDRGGHAGALAAGLAVLGLAAAPGPAVPADVEPPRVTVTQGGAVSTVEGRFAVPVPLPVAWHVLTDYDHIADFVGSVRLSAVEARRDSGLTLRQEVVGGLFPFRRLARLRLDVRERPDSTIEFDDMLGRDFRLYRGRWELRPDLLGTTVSYRLWAEPRAAAPGFVDRAVMGRAAQQLLAQVQAEMLRRAGSGSSGNLGAP